ncbi:hypothetical protein FOL47_002195, partial [Perkinsus chesapeaki]
DPMGSSACSVVELTMSPPQRRCSCPTLAAANNLPRSGQPACCNIDIAIQTNAGTPKQAAFNKYIEEHDSREIDQLKNESTRDSLGYGAVGYLDLPFVLKSLFFIEEKFPWSTGHLVLKNVETFASGFEQIGKAPH